MWCVFYQIKISLWVFFLCQDEPTNLLSLYNDSKDLFDSENISSLSELGLGSYCPITSVNTDQFLIFVPISKWNIKSINNCTWTEHSVVDWCLRKQTWVGKVAGLSPPAAKSPLSIASSPHIVCWAPYFAQKLNNMRSTPSVARSLDKPSLVTMVI